MFDQAFTGDIKIASKLDREEFYSLQRVTSVKNSRYNTRLWQGKQQTAVI